MTVVRRGRAAASAAAVLAAAGLIAAAARAASPAPAAPEVDWRAVESALDAVEARLAAPPAEDSAGRAVAADCARRLAAVERRLERLPMTDEVRERGWIRLRRVEAALPPLVNRLAAGSPAPLLFDNRHDAAARRWIGLWAAGRDLGRGVLHIDSHPDAGGLPEPARVDAALAHLRRSPADEAAQRALAAAVADINEPLAVAAMLGARGQVWVKPAWAVVRGEHRLGLRLVDRPADAPASPLCPAGGRCFVADPRRTSAAARAALAAALGGLSLPELTDLPPTPPGGTYGPAAQGLAVDLSLLDFDRPDLFGAVAHALPDGPFLLSIDLDFFATNGRADLPGNPCSAGRVDSLCGGVPAAPEARRAAWEAEVTAIEVRLRRFAALLAGLAAAGRRPSVVSLADSSWLQGARSAEYDGDGDFTPPDHLSRIRAGVVRAVRAAWPAFGAEWAPPNPPPEPGIGP